MIYFLPGRKYGRICLDNQNYSYFDMNFGLWSLTVLKHFLDQLIVSSCGSFILDLL